MVVVSLLHSSTTILHHPSNPSQRAPRHVGALFSAPRADTHFGFNGRTILDSKAEKSHLNLKFNRNKIRHVGVAYDHSKWRRRIMVPRASATTSFTEADILGSITIFTATGEPVQFKDLWDQNNGMATVALLRHFGCPCCWEFASTLKDLKPKFDSAGVKLIALGVGTPDKARILAERLPFPMDSLYADPDRKAYNALGLYYGLDRTFFNPASAKVITRLDSYRKALRNYTISATPEDRSSVLQQGGMYVFKGKELLYARKDEGTGDHAPLDDVLNICCRAPVS